MTNYEYEAKQLMEKLRNKDHHIRDEALITVEKYLDVRNIVDKLIHIAMFDDNCGTRMKAVRICNINNILYKGKPVRLRKMKKKGEKVIRKSNKTKGCVATVNRYFKNKNTDYSTEDFIKKYEQMYPCQYKYLKSEHKNLKEYFEKQIDKVRNGVALEIDTVTQENTCVN